MRDQSRTNSWLGAVCLVVASAACTSSDGLNGTDKADSGDAQQGAQTPTPDDDAGDDSAVGDGEAEDASVGDASYLDAELTMPTDGQVAEGDPDAATSDAGTCWTLHPSDAADVFLDLGVGGDVAVLRQTDTRLLVADTRRWILRDSATLATVAQGGTTLQYDRPGGAVLSDSDDHPRGLALVDLRGETLAVEGPVGTFAIRDAGDGSLLRTIQADARKTPDSSRASLSTDGSYLWVASVSGFDVWSTRTSNHFTLSPGNYFYRPIGVFAAPNEIRIAAGPAGANVIQVVDAQSGHSSTTPSFSGSFVAWFADGESFATNTGTSVWVYPRASGTSTRLFSLAGFERLGGYGDYLWSATSGGAQFNVYSVSNAGSAPVLSGAFLNVSFAVGSRLGLTQTSSAATTLAIVDLSSSTPSMSAVSGVARKKFSAFASSPSGAFSVADGDGVTLVFSGVGAGSYRTLSCGKVAGLAGSPSGAVAIATAGGVIIAKIGSSEAVVDVLPFSTDHMEMSHDGALLAMATGLHSVSVVSLDDGHVVTAWDGVDPNSFSLSGDGTKLGFFRATDSVVNPRSSAVLFAEGSEGRVEFAASGDSFTNFQRGTVPPDGFARFYNSYTLTNAVAGRPLGWLDDSRVLVVSYRTSGLGGVSRSYETTHIYDAQGNQLAVAPLAAELFGDTYYGRTFYTISTNRILNKSSIYDLTSGAAVWTTRAPPTFSVAAAGKVVYETSGRIIIEAP